MTDYTNITAAQAQQAMPQLCALLQACIADGASVGFTDPFDEETITRFWRQRIDDLAQNRCHFLVARQNGVIIATVLLNYNAIPNGRHRAEIAKLLVHPHARRQGIARQLMQRVEQQARLAGLSLLVLDTRSGDVASKLYLSLGWQVAGAIPSYAESPAGTLDATTIMYKHLD